MNICHGPARWMCQIGLGHLHGESEDDMDIRDALTRRGKALHRTLDGDERTFCGYRVAEFEPEEPGTKREWRERTRDMRTCYRCGLATEALAEENR